MLAIKFYETMPIDDENVLKGISPKIPAMVVDLDSFPNYKIDDTFIQMTNSEFNEYIKSIKIEIKKWLDIQNSEIFKN